MSHVRNIGKSVDDRDVERLSGMVREYIELRGRYSFDLPDVVREGILRPLPQTDPLMKSSDR